MNILKKWLLGKIISTEVVQGDHDKNIKALYALIRSKCEDEFMEDNSITLDAFLRELFESTQYKPK